MILMRESRWTVRTCGVQQRRKRAGRHLLWTLHLPCLYLCRLPPYHALWHHETTHQTYQHVMSLLLYIHPLLPRHGWQPPRPFKPRAAPRPQPPAPKRTVSRSPPATAETPPSSHKCTPKRTPNVVRRDRDLGTYFAGRKSPTSPGSDRVSKPRTRASARRTLQQGTLRGFASEHL